MRDPATHPQTPQSEKPCRAYAKGQSCKDGRDHCFNCGRHLDGDLRCVKRCGEGDSEANDRANSEDEDADSE